MKKFFTVSIVVLTIAWSIGLAGFIPVASATTFYSGDLIKASLPAVYYYGADGKRYVFPNEKTYKTWYADFSSVRTITDGELATIQIGGNVTYKPGVKMVKITTDPKVYAVAANGQLRWITTESLASTLYGATWTRLVEDVSDAFFTNYSVGAPINNASDYSPSAATAGAQSINVDKGLSGAVSGGALSVALASDTPAPSTVAIGAQANFTKIILSAGSTAVKINSIYVTRSGLSNNDDITNIKLVGMNGATVASGGSLGSNSKALLTFVPALDIPANTSQTYFIRASLSGGALWGNTIALAIAAASDVVLQAGTVTGAFPVVGSYMSVVALLNLGTATVNANALPPDSKPDAGTKRVEVSQFEVDAGPGEDLTVETLSLIEAGSASNADYANIELYSLTEGKTLGTDASFDANSRVVFTGLSVVIPKGSKHIFQVYTDVVSGSGNTLNVDLTDGNDVLVDVKGNTYGFYLVPVPLFNGLGTPQTIGVGILNVTRAVSSPATGNIAQAAEQSLTTWAYEIRGEPAKITGTLVTLTLAGGLLPANLTNAKLVDETGTVVAGPRAIRADAIGVAIAAGGCGNIGVPTVCAVFTETYIVPTGTHKYTFKIDVIAAGGLPAAGSINADITAPGNGVWGVDILATGLNTRDDMAVSAAPAIGNVQTIVPVALQVTTLTQPASRAVSLGTQNFVWATTSLDATASGEDVRVSAVTVQDTFIDDAGLPTANANNLQNISIWADLTSASSDRGDIYETKVSNNEQPVNNVASPQPKAISLTQVITVPKGTFVKLAIVADLSTVSDPGDIHIINISDATATGKSTGNPVVFGGLPVNPAGAGQPMTIAGAGLLTVALDAASPSKQLLISGAQKQTVGVIKLSADNVENQDLDQVIITDAGAAGNPGGVSVASAWYLYSSKRDDGGSITDPIAVAPGGAIANFQLADNTAVISANGSVTLTVKVDVAPVDGVTVANTYTLQVTEVSNGAVPSDIQTTGKSSGQIIPGSAAAAAVVDVAYASRPYVSLNAQSPSGALIPSANTLLAIFNVNADTADDITFDGPVAPDAVGGAALNTLTVQFATAYTETGAPDNDDCITVKDEAGNVLSKQGAVGCGAGFDTVAFDYNTGVLALNFGTKDLAITKGTTKKLYIYGDTGDFTTAGNSIQVWLDDGTAGNIDWSINYDGGNWQEADVIFRGGIYANALVKG